MAEKGDSYDEQVGNRENGFNEYVSNYFDELFTNIHNTPPERIPLFEFVKNKPGLGERLKRFFLRLAGHSHKGQRVTPLSGMEREKLIKELWFNLSHAEELGRTYESLGDDQSKRLLARVHAYRGLGPARMSLLEASGWPDAAASLRAVLEKKDVGSLSVGQTRFPLNQYDMGPMGSSLRLISTDVIIYTLFVLQQYTYETSDVVIDAAPRDIVIDGGMCVGESSLSMAEKVGPEGRVYGFEFMDEHLSLIRRNLALNPDLESRVEILRNALWHESGGMLNVDDKGPASRVSSRGAGLQVEALSIDDLVEREGLERVDFIKLDIEGAEKNALRGAEKSIRKYRPKLAISSYHLTDDHVLIPAMLLEMNPEYSFYLKHVTPVRQETVLFAV